MGLALLLTRLSGLAPCCTVWLLARHMPGASWVRRAAFAVMSLFALHATLLTLTCIVGLTLDPRFVLGVPLACGLLPWPDAARGKASTLLARSDYAALLNTFVVCLVMGLPLLRARPAEQMAMLSMTTDASTHVQLIAALFAHKGYVQGAHLAGLSPGVDHYPSAWHGNVWLLGSQVLGPRPSPVRLVRLASASALLTFGYLAYTTTAAACQLLSTRRTAALAVTSSVVLGLLLSSVGLTMLQLASFTEVMAVDAVLTLVLLAGTRAGSSSAWVVTAACCVTLAQCWYLLAPALLPAMLLARRREVPRRRQLLALLLLAAPACAFPLVTGPGVTRLMAPGPILLPTLVGLLGLLAACVTGLVSALRRSGPAGTMLAGSTVAALVLLTLVVLTQGVVPGSGFSYYAAKVFLAAALLGGVASAALLGAAVEQPRARPLSLLALVGLVCGIASTRAESLPPRWNPRPSQIDVAALAAAYAAHPRLPPAGTLVIIADGCDRDWDRLASKWLYDTSLRWTPGTVATLYRFAGEQRGDATALREALSDPSLQRLELYVHQPCDLSLLTALRKDPRTRVIRVR